MSGARFYKLPADVAARRDLRAAAKLVFGYIRYRIGGNATAWPGLRMIAAELGMSRESVANAVRQLADTGTLMVEKGQRGQRTVYSLPEQTGQETRPVDAQKWPGNQAGGGQETRPQVARKPGPNQREPLNQRGGPAPTAVAWDEDTLSFIVPPKVIALWRDAFPGVDVDAEIKKAGAWHAANRKWRSAFQAGITRWLTRTAKEAGDGGHADSGLPLDRDPTHEDIEAAFRQDAPAQGALT